MDGAMGTELQRAGIAPGECYELWNLTHREHVLAIHQAYVQAGAEVLLTNTFQAHAGALTKHGLQGRLTEIQTAGVALARAAAGPDRFVLADIGPHPDMEGYVRGFFAPYHRADGILLETMSDLEGLTEAIAGGPELPVLISFSFLRDTEGKLRTHGGLSPEAAARGAAKAGVAAVGTNCGRDISLKDIADIARCYRAVTDLPLFARPNAGSPISIGEICEYPATPQTMCESLQELRDVGIAMIGGCCGTTPEHIAAFRSMIAGMRLRRAAPSRER
jgi:methionine synthase I (cobalamin-dependent)